MNKYLDQMTSGTKLLIAAYSKPEILKRWLNVTLKTRITQLAVAIIAVLIVGFIADFAIKKIFPMQKTSTLFGLVERTTANPKAATARTFARIAIWTLSGGVIYFILISTLPKSIEEAEAESRRLESAADNLALQNPAESLRLYGDALAQTIASSRTVTLEAKTQASKEATMRSATMVSSNPDATVQIKETSATPSAFDRYSITKPLGQGATGMVYMGHDRVLERDVAIKELHSALSHDRDLVKRFRQEAKVLAKMIHPGVVQVFDFVEGADKTWIVMELVSGKELSDLIKETGKISVAETARLGARMAEALAYAHTLGIIHRDFKPSNVIITSAGEPKIMDFGLAKLAQSTQHTMAGTVLGTPYYMSPEQAMGKPADTRSDIYSFGVVLYRMLTGTVPFEGELAAVLSQHINATPKNPRALNPEITEPMDAAVMSMLMKAPEDRPQDFGAVTSTLKGMG